ncbi:MAG: N-acetyltransferase [Alphaproteobacteria bacterium]|nr:N-acetyltransferase [Alphaproteobacteria bacterium]
MSRLDDIPPRRWERDGWVITTDREHIEAEVVCAYLAAGDQSPGIPLETVRRMIAGSVNFGVFPGEPDVTGMVGYARVVTDFAAFAYIGDVFLLDGNRGAARGGWLMDCVEGHPDLQNLRRWLLMCGPRPLNWYKRRGFIEPERPGFALHKTDRQIYLRAAGKAE